MLESLRSAGRTDGRAFLVAAAIGMVAACWGAPAVAQPAASQPAKPARGQNPEGTSLARIGEEMNSSTIAVISGNPNGTYLQIAYDLSAVLDDGDSLRILPIIGKGGAQNVRDVRFLRGVDLGITQSNILGYYRRTGDAGNIDAKVVYIAKLFNEEMHFVVRSEITALEQLRGRKVNFSDLGSGTQLSTRDVFERLGIKVEEVNMGQADAFEAMKRGEIAASILIAGKPARSMATLKASDGFRILPVPFARPLHSDYLPSTLTSADYPGLIAAGQTVETVAVGTVLIAYNWPKNSERYRRVAKFVEAFFPRIEEFKKPPRHPKWKEANLTTTIPGWTRFPAAQEWLDRHHPADAQANSRQQFDAFLAARPDGKTQRAALSQAELDRLFQEYLKWRQTQGSR